ncbi:MAG: hypothetical protein AAF985_12785, partial [Bacteroidota bacterium]
EYLVEDAYLDKDEFLDKKQVFRWIHPTDQSFDDAKMRQTIYFFMKSLEEFLIFQELHQDELQAKIALARVFRKRKLDKSFQKNLRIAQQLQIKQDHRNGQFLQSNYLLEQEIYTYLSTIKRKDLNIQQVSDALDVTFIADKLRQSCLMLAYQTVYKTEYQLGLQNEVLNFVEGNKTLLDNSAIAIYYYGYKTITDKTNESHFRHLKKEMMANSLLFPQAELRDIYLMAINYCIGRMNAGMDYFIREAFELYREGFEKKIFLDNNTVSRWTFQNTVVNALKLKEFTWAQNFIVQYQGYLENKYRESFVNYTLALVFYEQKNFNAAMVHLLQSEHNDIIINLRAKNMLLKIYFQQGEHNALESLLESMRNYLVRKKVMGYHKSNFKNIIRLTKKLIKTNPYSSSQKAKLKQEIELANPLTGDERTWFLKQLEVLK